MNGLPDLFAVLSLLSHALKTVYIHTHAIVIFFSFFFAAQWMVRDEKKRMQELLCKR